MVCVRTHFIKYYGDNSVQFPIDIISIIIRFFFESFEWNSNKSHPALEFTMDNTFVSFNIGDKFCQKCCSSINVIDPEIYTYIEWEMTLNKFVKNDIYFGMCFLGIQCKNIDNWASKHMCSYKFPKLNVSIVVCTEDDEQICIYKHGKRVVLKSENASLKNIKNGDRFELRFDLNLNCCSFYLNDEFMADLVQASYLYNYTPAIPVLFSRYGHELQTTKWNVQYRKRYY